MSAMNFSGISRLLLASAVLFLGGCSWGEGSGAVNMPNSAGPQNSMIMEISDLQRRLANAGARAAMAEKEAQRARAETEWLAKAAQNGPQLESRNAELDAEVARLTDENKRIIVLEANLRELEVENDRLARALRGDWSEKPATVSSGPARTPVPAVSTAETLPEDGDFGEGNYAAHLASYRSKEAARDGWQRMQNLYPVLLGALSGHVAIFDVPSLGGRFFRLKAGPFSGAATAQALCRNLNNRGEYCVITAFDGEQLFQ